MTQTAKTEKHKSRAKVGAVVSAVALTCALGTMAYFTATDTVGNNFVVAGSGGRDALSVQVVEPNWDSTNANGIVPGQILDKDPYAQTTDGNVDSYIFMEVRVPVGMVDGVQYQPLFSLQGLNTSNENNQGGYFEQVGETFIDEGAKQAVTIYKWSDVVAGGKKTEPLFEKVQLNPKLTSEEAQALPTEVSIMVTAHAIQEQGFDSAEDAWAAYQAQNQQ